MDDTESESISGEHTWQGGRVNLVLSLHFLHFMIHLVTILSHH